MNISIKAFLTIVFSFVALSSAVGADCVVFEHRDFKGARLDIHNFERIKMTNGESVGCTTNGHSAGCWSTLHRPAWNDKISSYWVRRGCVLEMWEHVDARGWQLTRTGAMAFIGGKRNDKVSEALCRCG